MFSRHLAPFQLRERGLRASDPFSELHREMNRLFDDFMGGGSGQMMSMQMPSLDLREKDDELCICAELPGVDPAEVDVRLDGDVLTIRGEKKNDAEDDKENYHVMERSFGQFQRSIQLPFRPDPDQVRAEFRHGVLKVHVPKQPQTATSRRIAVDTGGAQAQPATPQATGQGGMPPAGTAQHH